MCGYCIHRVRRTLFDGLLEYQMGRDTDGLDLCNQLAVVDVTVTQCLSPDLVDTLPNMQLADSLGVQLQHIKQCNTRVSRAAINPVGIEAQRDQCRIGRQHHVVKFPSSAGAIPYRDCGTPERAKYL